MTNENTPPSLLIAVMHYPPDRGPSAPIYAELAEGLVQKGIDVSVITLMPHYDDEALLQKAGKYDFRNGVRIYRESLGFSFRKATGLKKIYGLLAVNMLFLKAYRKLERHDWILFHSPVFLYVFFLLLGRKKEKLMYHVQDLYPDIFCAMSSKKETSLFCRFIEKIESFARSRAEKIVTISVDMAKKLRSRTARPEKVHVVFNPVTLQSRSKALFREIILQDDFYRDFSVLFAGNMGTAQGLGFVLKAAEKLRSAKVRFLLVGDGSEKERLTREAEEKKLGNVVFYPYQDHQGLEAFYEKAGACLVSLSPGLSSMALPSKLYTAMAMGLPILGVFDRGSFAESLILKENLGLVVSDYNPESLAGAITWMASPSNASELVRMAENGLRYAEENLSGESFVSGFQSILFPKGDQK